ncbi:GNAT family N-acetyltransferase [Maribacter confluentis]|uniref:GNAT family N-acetyltransferase n=1 Tax=Maribacter confluentis TaxID=1656093 RepID=A0ABT8RPX3_9FLAO|nr:MULTISPECIES: GNAT family N-acetyltransferase [Maribacter]MDO1512399.1 GNAT family N-acetyltransferase [Maribacter confluentis]TVZ15626.1 L-amino acid N-acyltransferase YncA [Maribacter sp. MAR_2009_72]
MIIRKAKESDFDQVWQIFSEVIKTGDTYVFNPNTPKKDLKKHWFAEYMETYVMEENERILGTYILKPNQIDLGNHIANCSYMVNPDMQGKGVGKKLCEHSLKMAKHHNFEAIQFNIVVSTNKGAVALWKKYGFEIIGTTPKGFRHSELGLVDTYIMYKNLKEE